MRVLLAPFGSRGDVQPILALGLSLQARGHEVTVCAPPDFTGWIGRLGLGGHAIGPSMAEFVSRSMDGLSGIRYAMRALPELFAEQYRSLQPFCERCDVMLGSTLTGAGASCAEKLGFRYHYVTFTPAAIPSGEHPSLFTKSQGLPRWMNRLSWWQSAWANNFGLRSVINRERERLGLPGIDDAWMHLIDQRLIVASDPALAPVPADVPLKYVQTGAWFLPETEELAPEVEEYLAGGEPPVYVGFGSMPRPKARAVLESLRGRRAIVSGVPAPEGALAVGATPHGKLFPRCSLVIHHGGAGTTHTAARAGVPQQVVPHATDQFFWKKRLEERGLSGGTVEAALDLTANAKAFSLKMTLDGLQRAIELVERPPGTRL